MAINSVVQMKIARLTNKNTVIIHVENKDFKKSLEILTNDLNLAELKSHIDQIENQNLIVINKYRSINSEEQLSEKNKVSKYKYIKES